MANYGYVGRPTSAVINTSGALQLNPQRAAVVHADPSFQSGGYKVAYVNPITAQPTSGQIMVAPTGCQAQYPMVVDLSQAYKSSVGGGQCQPCSGATVTTTQPKQTPRRVNRCCPGCAPCCCGECDTYEDYPRQDCMCCGGCCPPPQTDAGLSSPAQQMAAPPQDCCSCHGCQTMCCGQPCCVCQPCQTNCCGPNGGCCEPNGGAGPNGECCGPNGGCCGPNGGCCGPNGGCCGSNGECCGPNDGCCGPNGGCCGPNGGCCGNCCQPIEVRPVTTQPAPADNQPVAAITVAPTNGPYTYRTSYNMAGFVPYNGQAVTMVPVDNKFVWGGAAVQPYTNVARQVFTQ